MSVSFTQVQAAVQNLTPTGGASGPLTLQVLHKTEALLSKLLAFDQSKPVSIEVLKATPNGRAEVIAGGLKLDVKASIPLKAGEVFQLKPEPAGSSFRFVQAPLKGADGVAGSVKTAVSGQHGQTLTSQLQTAKGPTPPGAGTAAQGAVTAKLPTLNTLNTGVSPANVTQGGATGVTTGSGVATQQTQNPTGSSGGATGRTLGGAVNSVSPQVTASALIKLAAETLPNGLQTGALARGQAHIQTSLQPGVQAGQNAGLSAGLSSGLQGAASAGQIGAAGRRGDERGIDVKSGVKGPDGSGGKGGQLLVTAEKVTAEQVTAKYSQFSSQPIEEVQELQGRQAPKADLTIELPLGGDAKPLMVQLQIGRDDEGQEAGDERDVYALRFSLETEETGPVHASVGLPFVQKDSGDALGKAQGNTHGNAAHFRVTIWAEQALFADMLEAERDLLIDRFAATGLDLSRLQIRRGRPLSLPFKDARHPGTQQHTETHLDSEI